MHGSTPFAQVEPSAISAIIGYPLWRGREGEMRVDWGEVVVDDPSTNVPTDVPL